MIKFIQYLQENAQILELLKDKKVSLVGVNEKETKAILEAFNAGDYDPRNVWG